MINQKYDIKQIGDLRVLKLYIYGDIRKSYTDFFGDVHESKTSSEYIVNAISNVDDFDQVNVYINSCGGDVQEGTAIMTNLKRIEKPVNVYIDGFAYSIASAIAMAGDKIVMPSNTSMMIHNAMMGSYGTSEDLRKAADDLDIINEASCNSYLIKSKKISRDKLNELLKAETFMTAEQALEYGFCDEIENPIDLTKSIEVAEQAARNRNPFAKKAIEQIQQYKEANPKPKPEPQPQQPAQKEQDCFEWLAKQFKFN